MLSNVLQICLAALASAVIIGFTIALLALMVYLVAGVIVSLIETFKEVRAKQQALKFIKSIDAIFKAKESDLHEK